MTHLGRWLSALVDGELDQAERDHVLNHLAGCEACRREANALRSLKRRMTALSETSDEPAVTRRLIDLGRSDPRISDAAMLASAGSPAAPADFPFAWCARLPRLDWKIATGSAGAIVVAIGVAAFLLGAPPELPSPQISPAVDTYWVEHVHDMGQAATRPRAPWQVGGSPGPAPAVAAGRKAPAVKPTAADRPATIAHIPAPAARCAPAP